MARKVHRAPTETVQDIDFWQCARCEDHPEFEGNAVFKAHVAEKHPECLDEEGRLPVSKLPTSHMDGKDFYVWTYDVRARDGEPLAVKNETRARRSGEYLHGSE